MPMQCKHTSTQAARACRSMTRHTVGRFTAPPAHISCFFAICCTQARRSDISERRLRLDSNPSEPEVITRRKPTHSSHSESWTSRAQCSAPNPLPSLLLRHTLTNELPSALMDNPDHVSGLPLLHTQRRFASIPDPRAKTEKKQSCTKHGWMRTRTDFVLCRGIHDTCDPTSVRYLLYVRDAACSLYWVVDRVF